MKIPFAIDPVGVISCDPNSLQMRGTFHLFREHDDGWDIGLIEINDGPSVPLILERPDFVAMALSGQTERDYIMPKVDDLVRQLLTIVGERKLLTA